MFEQNYEELRLESGQAVAPDVKQTALNQVLLYWRKLRAIAEGVTDTEVHLSLPRQRHPVDVNTPSRAWWTSCAKPGTR